MEITLTQFNRSMNKYFNKVIAGEEVIIRRRNGEKYAVKYCSPEELECIQKENKPTKSKTDNICTESISPLKKQKV